MKNLIIFIFISLFISDACAAEKVVDLHVNYKNVCVGGVVRRAIAVNDQIPGPSLRFQEGDKVTLRVHNHLYEGTAIHWHGIIVPWQMDGIANLSQRPIEPNTTFEYKFTLKQSGTYWYHAHKGLQEQLGLYGALIVEPKNKPAYTYNQDFAIVLSDWSNTYPDKILKNLKKTGDYYAPRLPIQPSLQRFLHDYKRADRKEKRLILEDYLTMQHTRLNFYNFSSVAYDAFLLNGQPNKYPWQRKVQVGDTVRLRFIGAASGTIFNVKIPNTKMRLVQIQGNDIKPITVKKLGISPGETYDVLVKINDSKPKIIYAESLDKRGKALGALVTQDSQKVDYKSVKPFPMPLPLTRTMTTNIMANRPVNSPEVSPAEREREAMKVLTKNHNTLNIPLDVNLTEDKIEPPSHDVKTSPTTKYQNIAASHPTNDPNKPLEGTINLELFGYMERFIWFINGVPNYDAKPMVLKPNKRYRIVFTNLSMLYIPMQVHGHWFILRNGHGYYDPLLHTINVPPGATITADVDTDASGQWLFHYRMLYYMMTGISRVFQYSTLLEIVKDEAKPQNVVKDGKYINRPIIKVDEARPIDKRLVEKPIPHKENFWLASFIDIAQSPIHNVQRLTYKGLYGLDYHKLELFMNDNEVNRQVVQNADIDILYWHLLSQFWAAKVGVNYFNRPAERPYWQAAAGIEGIAPYFIYTNARFYFFEGSLKLDFELIRDTQITDNFFLRTAFRTILATKTVDRAVIGSGLNQVRYLIRPYYRLLPGLNIFAEYEMEQDYGAFKVLEELTKELEKQKTITLGISVTI